MGTLPVLSTSSIASIRPLPDKPIFFITITGQTQETVVVKGEVRRFGAGSDGPTSILWSHKILRQTNDKLSTLKLMTPSEIQAFKQLAAPLGQTNPSIAYFLNNANNVWVKMSIVNGLTDASVSGNYQEKYQSIRQTVIKLWAPTMWQSLGRVVAGDIFNGNGDRIGIEVDRGLYKSNWGNMGNLMFAGNGVAGLDAFDPNYGGYNNLVRDGRFDELDVLTDSAKRRIYAHNVTVDIGTKLGAELGAISREFTLALGNTNVHISAKSLQRLFVPRAEDFDKGMVDGANQMKTYLQAKIKQYKIHNGTLNAHRFAGQRGPQATPAPTGTAKTIPQGVLDRMTYLDWMPKAGW